MPSADRNYNVLISIRDALLAIVAGDAVTDYLGGIVPTTADRNYRTLLEIRDALTGLGSGSGSVLFLSGHGHPEGVTQGNRVGQSYIDLDTGNMYYFAGTVGTNTGWIP